jgi:endo-1,4-beta-D-glucanase Y
VTFRLLCRLALALGLWTAAIVAGKAEGALDQQPYAAGTIRPDHLDAAALDRQLVAFYRDWKALYVVQGCGDGRSFVKVDADGKPMGGGTAPGTITVSEAHGYGMLLMVMMAPVDPEARAVFDGMLRYFKDHPAASDPGLLAWDQVKGCGNAGGDFRGALSATDGDLDIAYALLLADARWGRGGAFDYRAEAVAVMAAILRHEVDPKGMHLMIGDWAATDGDDEIRATTRPSDFMLSHLRAFADATGDARWLAVRDRTYAIIDSVRRRHSPKTGLMPDFIAGLDGDPAPARAGLIGDPMDGFYSWNAARYPWRVGLDLLLYGDDRARAALRPFNAWARRSTGDDPARFADTYRLDGTTLPDHGTDEPAYVSALGVAAMIDPANQDWLNRIWDDLAARPLAGSDYYGNTLKLLAMVTMAGHWPVPPARP